MKLNKQLDNTTALTLEDLSTESSEKKNRINSTHPIWIVIIIKLITANTAEPPSPWFTSPCMSSIDSNAIGNIKLTKTIKKNEISNCFIRKPI
jgi:hypothetical protein